MNRQRRVQFVVKTSKHCNLRCRYCYEYAELGTRESMPLERLEQAYVHIADWYKRFDQPTLIEFDWHGGEPLLLAPDYYWRTLDAQRRILRDPALSLRNVVQTNLTVLDEERLRLLKEGFDGVGVSVDLFGGLRVNGRGVDSVDRVLRNLDRLRANGIDFGCLTVLTKANLSAIPRIITFYEALKVSSVRFLPLFDGAYEDQHRGYEITHDEIVSGLQAVFEELLSRDVSIRVEPIHRYINQVIQHHTPGAASVFYNKREWESIYIIDVNGDLYSYADAYDPNLTHGNLFQSPMHNIVLSEGHERAIAAAELRMASVCHSCRFYGSCDGYPVAEETSRHRLLDEGKAECVAAKSMLSYIERRMIEMGVINPITAQVRLPEPRATFRHIEALPLQAGTRIHFPDEGHDVPERIMLSSGTTAKVVPPSDGLTYISAALVPKEPWRQPTSAELSLLRATSSLEKWDIGAHVAVIRIPDDVIAPLERIFEEYGTRETLDPQRYRIHTDHPNWDEAYNHLIEYLQEHYAISDHVPRIVRLATAPPEMKTVTKDSVAGQSNPHYVGMHLDSWRKTPLTERHESQNRICVNLGRGARYLLFINLTLMQMFQALGRSARADLERDYFGLQLGHDFMRAFPAYPVTRLRVGPREAYIAPTENFLHDGSSVGTQHPDIGMHILGYFGLRN